MAKKATILPQVEVFSPSFACAIMFLSHVNTCLFHEVVYMVSWDFFCPLYRGQLMLQFTAGAGSEKP
ncbi:MAG: hypothetical protein B0D92_02025 [Spirochaeta sp. LUC14_002_19_P3]|nr:MAG: hypothetical protein B0D92_02025 [Spirochaeta sp. LUC14_002_19_P3]